MKVTVFSHHFTVTGHDQYGYKILKEFAFRYAEYDYRLVNRPTKWGQPKPKPTLKKIFATFSENRRIFRYHINTFDDFIAKLTEEGKKAGIDYDIEYIELYKPKDVGLSLMDGFTPRGDQPKLIDYLVDEGVIKMLNLQTGQGKAQWVGEPVLTPSGWRRIGDLKVGDKVRCPDNSIANVTGVFPQGNKPTFAFYFKGIAEPIICDYQHLWEVTIRGKVQVHDASLIYQCFHTNKAMAIEVPRVDVDENFETSNERLIEIEDIIMFSWEDCVCISIDHPRKVYVTRNGIVTHNTFCALAAAVKLGKKIFISIESRFFNLWREAFDDGPKKVLDVDGGSEVLYIQGSKDLGKLLNAAKAGTLDSIKVFVVSSRTMGIFFETYEKYNGMVDGVYPCAPHQIFEALEVGTRIKDEVHLSLHANFKEELYLHVPKNISLSATLEDGSFLDKILAIMFPQEMRSPEVDYLKYIAVNSLMYVFNNPNDIKYTRRGSSDYSHNAFEECILKSPKQVKNNYLTMIAMWVRNNYIEKAIDKQKGCVFVSSVEMATEVQKFLQAKFPDKKVTRYAASAGDKYAESREGDILVTTIQSFGTGFDLPDLICTLMTTSLRSQKTNLQVLGRLRVLKNYPDTVPLFEYLVCSDIPKHIQYHEIKRTQFYGKVKSHGNKFLNMAV